VKTFGELRVTKGDYEGRPLGDYGLIREA